MTPTEVVREATTRSLSDADGDPVVLKLRPGMSPSAIDALAGTLPCPMPSEIRELLAFCSGFEGGAADVVDFTGHDCSFEYVDIFPHGHPIAADGFGNFWVVDLLASSTRWGPIYFACHDAPVILYQSATLEDFLVELFKSSEPPFESLVRDVHEDRLFNVWRTNPGAMSQQACLTAADPELRAFAQQLDASFQVVDLRQPRIGCGFSWGRYGPKTVIRRFGELPIFACQKPQGRRWWFFR